MAKETYTLKQLAGETGCPFYILKYLHQCNRLPVAIESKGSGYPTRWKAEAVKVVKNHMAKND